MSPLDYQLHYERHLPHIQPGGASFLITSRLYGSLPRSVLTELDAEKRRRQQDIDKIADRAERLRRYDLARRELFGRYDDALHRTPQGPFWLRRHEIAQLVADSLHFRDGQHYTLHAYTIMSNHLHLVCTPLRDEQEHPISLSRINHAFKSFTAHSANSLLRRKGPFWQNESHDHYARDADELGRIIQYVMNNPVKAGMVEKWDQWPWTYVSNLPH